MYGLKTDWIDEPPPRYLTLQHYEGQVPRWCPYAPSSWATC